MDTLSHALWGYASLRWRGVKSARVGALAGAAPDILFFLPSAADRVRQRGFAGMRVGSEPEIWRAGGPPMPPELIQAYERYYVWTHSLVILAIAAALLFLLRRRSWAWLAIPYALHIFMDIPTHERYLTPFLFPISMFTIEGLSWGDPRIFIPNWVLLLATLGFLRWRFAKPT